MKSIFKISEYIPETNQIIIRFCRLHAPKNIDEYRPVSLDLNDASGGFTIGQGSMLYDGGADGVIEFTGAEL